MPRTRRNDDADDLDFGEATPTRSRPQTVAVPWIGMWFTVFTSVLLANLLTAAILYLGVRAYVSYKIDQFNEATKQQMK